MKRRSFLAFVGLVPFASAAAPSLRVLTGPIYLPIGGLTYIDMDTDKAISAPPIRGADGFYIQHRAKD